MYLKLASLPRKIKIIIVLLADILLIPLALWSAIALRIGTTDFSVEKFWWIFFALPFVTIPIFLKLGLYRAVIRFFDEKIIFTVILGMTTSVFILSLLLMLTNIISIPRSSIIIYWLISVTYLTLSRYLARGLMRQFERQSRKRQRVAIYGAGRAGIQTASSMMSSNEYQPVMFFDDSSELQGTSIAGLRVYKPEQASELMSQYDCHQILFAIPSATKSQRKKIIESFEQKGIQLKIIPGLNAIVDGKIKIEDIREVGIEDLLGRDPVPPDNQLISNIILDKVILVTGGGGSIGSEICRQVCQRQPSKLIIYEQNEYALYKIEKELSNLSNNTKIVTVLGDVQDTHKLAHLIENHQVDSVFHAAAYKHVPLVEENIVSGVLNNVFGTLSVLKSIENSNVKNFVLISTDKAVRPTNVMGATKRIAEMCVQMYSDKMPRTKFSMVRFGNVLGSSGSVVPLFKEQIKAGGPITVTHPEITRYFMTIPEACELVLQAAAMAHGGDLFVLDMGEPIKIVDLAKNIIKLSGYTVRDEENPEGDIAIEFVGLRPGEKLYEELLIGNNVSHTEHPRIKRAQEDSLESENLCQHLNELKSQCAIHNSEAALQKIKDIVKEFNHNSK